MCSSDLEHLDDQMRELIKLAKVAKRILKAVIKGCKRGERQTMYAENDMKNLLESAYLDTNKLARDQEAKQEAVRKDALKPKKPKKTLRKWTNGLLITLALSRPRTRPRQQGCLVRHPHHCSTRAEVQWARWARWARWPSVVVVVAAVGAAAAWTRC